MHLQDAMPAGLLLALRLLDCCEQEMGNQVSIKSMKLSSLFFLPMNFNANLFVLHSNIKLHAIRSSCLIIDKCIIIDWAWLRTIWL